MAAVHGTAGLNETIVEPDDDERACHCQVSSYGKRSRLKVDRFTVPESCGRENLRTLEEGWEKSSDGSACIFIGKKCSYSCQCNVNDIQNGRETQNMPKIGTTSQFTDRVSLGCTHSTSTCLLFGKLISTKYRCQKRGTIPDDITAWSYDMDRHAPECVERCCELAHMTVDQLQKVSKLCLDDHQMEPRRSGSCGRVLRDLLSYCIEMIVFGKDWKTRFISYGELFGKIRHQVEPIVRS